MIRRAGLGIALLCAFAASPPLQTRDERLAWWRDARFGMFVHWGVYSGLGNEFHGRKGGGYAEHIQRVLKIPVAQYREEVAGTFNPSRFDADEWIRRAAQAGMGYFVITAKHHDGFAMWPTKVNTYNIVQATPFRRDPMRELRDACRKYGVKFGFYYSHAFDWGEADAPGNDWDYNNPGGDKLLGGANWWETRPEFLPKARGYVDRKAIPQLRELVAEYQPDILWFDTPHKLPPAENQRILDAVRAMAPGVVVNGRLMRGAGDYESTADRPAEFSPHDGDWEGIPTTNESYGWNKFDRSHKPVSHFIRILAKAVARGGNILMNIGPMGDGTFDPADVAILDGIGAWWKVNGESIRGAGRSPLAVQTWGESTLKGSRLYLHVFDWPADGRLVVGGLKTPVTSAWLLAKGASKRRAVTRLNPLDVSVALPSEAPDRSDAVVVLELGGAVDADVVRLLQPSFTNETLRAFDAQLHGGLRFGPGKRTDDYVLGWSSMSDNVTWRVRLPAITTYEVDANYDAPAASAGGSYTVAFGAQKLSGTVSSGTGQRVRLGRVTLAPGAFDITVTATTIAGAELLRLRGLTLISYRPASR